MFGFEFVIRAFQDLSIFGIGEQIGDLCDLPFSVFVLVGDLKFSVDIFWQW